MALPNITLPILVVLVVTQLSMSKPVDLLKKRNFGEWSNMHSGSDPFADFNFGSPSTNMAEFNTMLENAANSNPFAGFDLGPSINTDSDPFAGFDFGSSSSMGGFNTGVVNDHDPFAGFDLSWKRALKNKQLNKRNYDDFVNEMEAWVNSVNSGNVKPFPSTFNTGHGSTTNLDPFAGFDFTLKRALKNKQLNKRNYDDLVNEMEAWVNSVNSGDLKPFPSTFNTGHGSTTNLDPFAGFDFTFKRALKHQQMNKRNLNMAKALKGIKYLVNEKTEQVTKQSFATISEKMKRSTA